MTIAPTTPDVRRVGGRLGAEIVGVDLSQEIDAALAADLNSSLVEHKVLVFRGQNLDDDAHVRFASAFGALTTAHPTVPSIEGQENVLRVEGAEGNRDYAPHPQFRGADREEYHKVFVSKRYRTAHPVVRIHPDSGTPNLFIGGFAGDLIGLSHTESRDILRLLQAYVTRPENTLRWRWSLGDVVVFDNRATQHYAADDYGDLPRELHRVTVAGDVPVGADGATSYVIEGDQADHYTPRAA